MYKELEGLKIPKHVAIIMDGNGRWAKSKGMPRTYGHKKGGETLEDICEKAYNMGIEYLTVYAFSTENWNRPKEEVDTLMDLFDTYLRSYLKKCQKNKMCVRFIGERSRLSEKLRTLMDEFEAETKDNTGLKFTIAINYGGRDELVRTTRKIAQKVADGELKVSDIDDKVLNDNLDTWMLPDPDLMIRTTCEYRISNYLLWQLAYTEFYFTAVPWPEFNEAELIKAIEAYNHRDRRYGGLTKE